MKRTAKPKWKMSIIDAWMNRQRSSESISLHERIMNVCFFSFIRRLNFRPSMFQFKSGAGLDIDYGYLWFDTSKWHDVSIFPRANITICLHLSASFTLLTDFIIQRMGRIPQFLYWLQLALLTLIARLFSLAHIFICGIIAPSCAIPTRPKNVVQAVKKKMLSPNPHTAYYGLLVLESIVKNCGAPIHDEIMTKENCEMFTLLIENTTHENVKTKLLELIQNWAYAFRTVDKHQAIKVRVFVGVAESP